MPSEYSLVPRVLGVDLLSSGILTWQYPQSDNYLDTTGNNLHFCHSSFLCSNIVVLILHKSHESGFIAYRNTCRQCNSALQWLGLGMRLHPYIESLPTPWCGYIILYVVIYMKNIIIQSGKWRRRHFTSFPGPWNSLAILVRIPQCFLFSLK